MQSDRQQVHLFVSGTVQGVGYRQFVRSYARKLGVVGWVRNLPDGRVEAVLQGEKESIAQLIRRCKRGPLLARVHDTVVTREEIQRTFESFSVER